MLKANLYSPKVKTVKSITLPKSFEEKLNLPLLAQAIRVYEDRSHVGHSKTLTRSEIALTKAKWYRQKGTGRARHGAQSAPIFVGGSKAHGPKLESKVLTLPKKMRKKALLVALSAKAEDKKVVAAEALESIKKTVSAGSLVENIRTKEAQRSGSKITIVFKDPKSEYIKFFKNLENVHLIDQASLNAWKVYSGGLLIFEKSCLENAKN